MQHTLLAPAQHDIPALECHAGEQLVLELIRPELQLALAQVVRAVLQTTTRANMSEK